MINKIFAGLKFDNSYSRLPNHFYERVLPMPVENPSLICLNKPLAKSLGINIEEIGSRKGEEFFAGNFIAPNSEPIALAYAGHQFGYFTRQLGDGRAVLLGEILDSHGNRFDIQLKGAGQTSFSRRGDGRAALGPVIREYIVSEAMHALGINTTRSLAFVTTGEPVFRETALPGAIITRVASSHIRVGTFEYFAAKGDLDSVKTLADYTINRHYPECLDENNPYISLLKKLSEAQARLIASWMGVGFIHGVMNTDNTSIAGETIDYGPCAFMDEYDPSTVFSAIDQAGRYAYINQPHIAGWNLARFAQALLPLFDKDMSKAVEIAKEIIAEFYPLYQSYWLKLMRKKIGLFAEKNGDLELINEFLHIMHQNELDFTNSFRNLVDLRGGDNDPAAVMSAWVKKWYSRLDEDESTKTAQIELMESANPVYIPRNHQVEKAIRTAVDEQDFSVMGKLIKVLAKPYTNRKIYDGYTKPPQPEERVQETFCGT